MAEEAKIQQFALLAKGARGRGLVDLIAKATSEPLLFTFGELLDVSTIKDVQQGELAQHFHLLELFAFGTWPEYKGLAGSLPEINAQQALKLKQLTLVSLASASKTIPYETLMGQLDVPTVRELEDFVITECFYTGLVKGKLDQKMRTLQVHDVISRDVKQEQLVGLEQALGSWMNSTAAVMRSIEERIQYSGAAAEAANRHRTDFASRQEDAKLAVRGSDNLMGMGGTAGWASMADDDGNGGGDYMDFEDHHPARGGGGDRLPSRPKSRRR